MSFTYALVAPYTDLARVRFHIGDVQAVTPMFQDEEITFRIAESGTWQAAVIDCLESIIAQLSMEGEFTAGWLTIRKDVALRNFTMLLKRKSAELGVAAITATAVYLWRPDNTNTTEQPTYDRAVDDDIEDE